MPPKKRKAPDTDSEQEPSQASTSTKKLKKSGTLDSLPHNGQPTNRVLPVKIEFEKRAEGNLRIATWNVCGFAASSKKGFKFYVEAEDADILVLTETKVSDKPTDPALMSRYPYQYWIAGEKKGHGGTAILSKFKPLTADYKLPGYAAAQGRIVTLEFPNCYLIGTYVVNAGQDLKTLGEKQKWMTQFDSYLRDLDAKKPVIWTGDINIAPTAIDLQNSKKAWNKQPGYTEVETSAFKKLLASPEDAEAPQFVDVWRSLNPGRQHYTYWSYRFQSREKGNGWRLDMFILSSRLVEQVKQCTIRDEIYGASDHVPIILDIEAGVI